MSISRNKNYLPQSLLPCNRCPAFNKNYYKAYKEGRKKTHTLLRDKAINRTRLDMIQILDLSDKEIKGTMINKVKGPSRKSGKPLKLGGSISAER